MPLRPTSVQLNCAGIALHDVALVSGALYYIFIFDAARRRRAVADRSGMVSPSCDCTKGGVSSKKSWPQQRVRSSTWAHVHAALDWCAGSGYLRLSSNSEALDPRDNSSPQQPETMGDTQSAPRDAEQDAERDTDSGRAQDSGDCNVEDKV